MRDTASPVRLSIETAPAVEAAAAEPRARARGARRAKAWEAEESYRKAALFLSKLVATGGRSVLVCSARRGEGTTTAVLSLAHQLQESYGLRPLVIELPRRKGALAKLFTLDPEATLQHALGRLKLATECIQVTASGIPVIPGESESSAAGTPLLAPDLKRVLGEVEELFDVVLVDAPPILTQADAIIAATVIPTVVLVVEAGRTSFDILDRASRELAAENVRIAGTLLVKQKRFIPRWIDWWFGR